MTMKVDWGSGTHVGRVRDNNEDSLLVLPEFALGVLCDGMGGHRAGEVASRIAVETVATTLRELRDRRAAGQNGGDAAETTGVAGDLPQLPCEITFLVESAAMANMAIFAQARSSPDHRGMGCTLVALRLCEGEAFFTSVGDSRLYLLRRGELRQISDDHTRLRMLERMGIAVSPGERRLIRGVLTRALGTQTDLEVDYGRGAALAGDVWLLCSDGLTDELSDSEIASILREPADAQAAAKTCVERAVKAGGRDNVSVIVARILSGSSGTGNEELPAIQTVSVSLDRSRED